MDLADRLQAAVAARYEVERELGRGGMAVVFLGHDLKLNRPVAIKVLRPELGATLHADRFLQEIEIAAGLQHPNILAVHDWDEADDLLYYVMPYVEGESLKARILREIQLPLDEALRITSEVADALSHAHARGIVHRDIKPENILLSNGHAVVADFGIARAVTAAGGEGYTLPGMALGTPPYMSPEQASGAAMLDGRSDIYSLACVLFEMLAGEPPFTGPTPQSVVAKHVSEPPPSLHVVRPNIPDPVERAVDTALAKVPADRYTTATDFAAALRRASRPYGPKPWVFQHPVSRWIVAGIAVAALALVGVLSRFVPELFGTDVDERQHVVATDLMASALADFAEAKKLEVSIERMLKQVPDVTVAESARVVDQRQRLGADSLGLQTALDLAREVGSGRLVLLSLTDLGDSTLVIAQLYDVRRRRFMRSAEIGVLPDSPDLDLRAARLVEDLLDIGEGVLTVDRTADDTTLRAYTAGRMAYEKWDLAGAIAAFRQAARLDPEFAPAHYWVAYAGLLAGTPSTEWIAPARRAAALRDHLNDPRERAIAGALLAMAEANFPQACAVFDSLVAANPTSFDAWFGLAECHRQDPIVVRDPSSRSGWSFRSSYHAAARAYERALEVAPSFRFALPAARLEQVLMVRANQVRRGSALPPDTSTFWGVPGLEGDTVAVVPYPTGDVQRAQPGTYPATQYDALDVNRRRLLRIAERWVRAFPDSSNANRSLAFVLEADGRLDGGTAPERWALPAIRRAASTARTAGDSLLAAVPHVRILLKTGRFTEARELASLTLLRWPAPPPDEARLLAPLAALLGRAHDAARLAAAAAEALRDHPSGAFRTVALPVLAAKARFEAYASLGAPAESVRVAARQLEAEMRIQLDVGQIERLGCRLTAWGLTLAFELRRQPADSACAGLGLRVNRIQWALLRNDSIGMRAGFRRLEELDRTTRPGDVAIDAAYREAWLRLQPPLGDSTGAIARLDAALAALPAGLPALTEEVWIAAGLVRSMALRADLAQARGDRDTGRRWAGGVVALWRSADRDLQNTVQRMGALLR